MNRVMAGVLAVCCALMLLGHEWTIASCCAAMAFANLWAAQR